MKFNVTINDRIVKRCSGEYAAKESDRMYSMPGRCPVCGDILETTRLHCRQCDTMIEGHFSMERLSRLSAEQLSFVETFLRCEGTIKRVEKELGVSYPTVRSRLEDVIRTLGFEVISTYPAGMEELSDTERTRILDQLDRGEIAYEEALRLLRKEE